MASIIDKDRFRGREPTSHGQGGGGGVDNIVKRLEGVDSAVTELRVDVCEIKAILPTLATKEELAEARGDIRELKAAVSHCATKAELNAVEGSLRSEIHAMETRIIKWIVGAVVGSVGAASAVSFSVAKFIS